MGIFDDWKPEDPIPTTVGDLRKLVLKLVDSPEMHHAAHRRSDYNYSNLAQHHPIRVYKKPTPPPEIPIPIGEPTTIPVGNCESIIITGFSAHRRSEPGAEFFIMQGSTDDGVTWHNLPFDSAGAGQSSLVNPTDYTVYMWWIPDVPVGTVKVRIEALNTTGSALATILPASIKMGGFNDGVGWLQEQPSHSKTCPASFLYIEAAWILGLDIHSVSGIGAKPTIFSTNAPQTVGAPAGPPQYVSGFLTGFFESDCVV